ncbi:hypothetical protein N656DRAFT_219356 [Canariomyces notabilis]|uniref:Uncharacterized protein n=1 Tax=Canariomyces notabilis TaxID=2074819 RepID=A0AAN6TK66_9PEZI|nr:hypothetical protein N656DRAFT_219356 [Canariomyces arenarius]
MQNRLFLTVSSSELLLASQPAWHATIDARRRACRISSSLVSDQGERERSGSARWSLSVAPCGLEGESIRQMCKIVFLFLPFPVSHPAPRVAHVRCLCAAMRKLKWRDVTPKTFLASSSGRLPTAEAKQ